MSTGISEQVKIITGIAEAGGNVALIGPPGMGKSWTLQRVASELRGVGLATHFADLQNCGSTSEALTKLLQAAGSKRHRIGPDLLWHDLAARTWDREPSVLVLDEFDAVRRFPDGAEFLRNLRERVQFSAGKGGPTIVIAARRPLWMIEEAVSGISTLESVFTPRHCSLMSPLDLADAWPDIFPEMVDFESAIRWSHGVPEICTRLSERSRSESRAVFDEYDRAEWSANVVDYFVSIGLGSSLPQYVLGPVIGKHPMDLARLIAMSAIPGNWRQGARALEIETSTTQGTLWEFQPFVEELRHRSESLEAWGPRGRAEKFGRQLVTTLLEPEEWGAGHHPSFSLLLSARARANAIGVHDPSLAELVAHLDEGELWKIVSRCGGRTFSLDRPSDISAWKPLLEPLGGLGRMRGAERSREDARFDSIADSLSKELDRLNAHSGIHESPASFPASDQDGRVGEVSSSRKRGWGFWGALVAVVGTLAGVVQVILEIT